MTLDLRLQVQVPDYSKLGEDGLPLSLTVDLDPKKDFKQNAKLCFKQARGEASYIIESRLARSPEASRSARRS